MDVMNHESASDFVKLMTFANRKKSEDFLSFGGGQGGGCDCCDEDECGLPQKEEKEILQPMTTAALEEDKTKDSYVQNQERKLVYRDNSIGVSIWCLTIPHQGQVMSTDISFSNHEPLWEYLSESYHRMIYVHSVQEDCFVTAVQKNESNLQLPLKEKSCHYYASHDSDLQVGFQVFPTKSASESTSTSNVIKGKNILDIKSKENDNDGSSTDKKHTVCYIMKVSAETIADIPDDEKERDNSITRSISSSENLNLTESLHSIFREIKSIATGKSAPISPLTRNSTNQLVGVNNDASKFSLSFFDFEFDHHNIIMGNIVKAIELIHDS